MSERQFVLDGYRFGRGCLVEIEQDGVDFGDAGIRSSVTPRGRANGVRWGRDYRDGRTISFTMAVLADNAREELGRIASVWNAAAVRSRPGGVSVLSWELDGDAPVRVFGRPQKFAANPRLLRHGWVPIEATFDTVDHLFYDDLESTANVGIVAEASGGLVLPLSPPLRLTGSGSGRVGIEIGGTDGAWLIWAVDGPVTDPQIEVVGQWSATLTVTLASDQTVVADPTPWGGTVRRNDGANLAGEFTAGSQRLTAMWVPSGSHEVILRGQDPTGTARLRLFWRRARASF